MHISAVETGFYSRVAHYVGSKMTLKRIQLFFTGSFCSGRLTLSLIRGRGVDVLLVHTSSPLLYNEVLGRNIPF